MKPRRGREVHCHKLIWSTACEMAGELYDDVMKDNEVFESWHRVCPELTPLLAEIKFIELLAPKLIPRARATLAALLGTNNIAESQKQIVYDALIADATLMRGRGVEHHSVGPVASPNP